MMEEKKLRTRAEVESSLREKYRDLNDEAIEALTTLNLTTEEQLADLRSRYPNTSEEALLSYAKDEETIAHSVLDGDIEEAMWQALIDEDYNENKRKEATL